MDEKKKAKPKAKKSLTQSKVNHLENGNIELLITLPWAMIKATYQKTLVTLSKKSKIKGFRPGKAPTNLVEKQLGKEKIYQEMLKSLLTDVYIEAFQTHKIVPIVNPHVSLLSSQEDKDWEVKVLTAQLPEIKLGNYREEVRIALAAEKIWVPGKDQKKDQKEASQEEKLGKIFATLLKSVAIDLPALLLEEEVNRKLSRLIDQTARLGLTVEQYLTSISKTADQLRAEYQKQAEESVKLELILASIADQEKINVTEAEIDKITQTAADPKKKKAFASPEQTAYLRQVLRKRKVIDILLAL